jgi:phenylacetate-CoA ligase
VIERVFLRGLFWTLGLVRLVIDSNPRTSLLFHLPFMQPLLAFLGKVRAREVFLKARDECPAYASFLAAHDWRPGAPIPPTDKPGYVKAYPIEQRCYGGAIPGGGVVVDESSGSSGAPNNWVRSKSERRDVAHILRLAYGTLYGDRKRVLLNCFALGPWATGMNVSMALADVGILKSIGPDAAKLEATLRTFGPSYRYLVFAYPPFARAFQEACTLDLSGFTIDVIVGGEGISEPLRDRLLKTFRSVLSSYGASDLEINIASETPWTIALRRACVSDPALCKRLFGRDTPPMIFQYNALDFVIEATEGGGLLYTICRVDGAAPKVRYDLKDVGGTCTMAAMKAMLKGVTLPGRASAFPILWVFGRGDLTIAFYGAKLYPTDFEAVIASRPALAAVIRGFQCASHEDEEARRTLVIRLELVPAPAAPVPAHGELRDAFYEGLALANQDFREVRRMFAKEAIAIEVHAFGTGPFEGADDRIKRKYVAD